MAVRGPSQWRRAGLRRQRPYNSGTATRNLVLGTSPPGVGPARKVDSEGLHWDCLASSRPTALLRSSTALRLCWDAPGPAWTSTCPSSPHEGPRICSCSRGLCPFCPRPGLQTAAGTQEAKHTHARIEEPAADQHMLPACFLVLTCAPLRTTSPETGHW